MQYYNSCNGIMYTIKEGDTLYTISGRFQVPIALILRANPHTDIYNLQIGAKLCIPRYGLCQQMCSTGRPPVRPERPHMATRVEQSQTLTRVEQPPTTTRAEQLQISPSQMWNPEQPPRAVRPPMTVRTEQPPRTVRPPMTVRPTEPQQPTTMTRAEQPQTLTRAGESTTTTRAEQSMENPSASWNPEPTQMWDGDMSVTTETGRPQTTSTGRFEYPPVWDGAPMPFGTQTLDTENQEE